MIGQTLSHYRITAKLGAGGMGEVYRAEDTVLGRQVAIKVLSEGVVSDPERLARFEREAKVLASLNHPHIAAIYGLEEAESTPFLILELVEGETLAERIDRGGLSLAETVELCQQIAEALEAAHEQGIIHRDLKPANVKITPAGQVKVLDFGLAKALRPDGEGEGASSAALSASPTLTAQMTAPGVLLGTAAYMSPEQVRGEEAGKQSDVWAFGCVLYEALTGRGAFLGKTISDTVAHILERDPDWSALPDDTPPLLRILLHRCLQKEKRDRLHDIGDARIEIREASESPSSISKDLFPGAPASRSGRSQAVPWVLLSVSAAAVVVVFAFWGPWRGRPVEPQPPRRFVAALPEGHTIPFAGSWGSTVTLSRDGSQLVYVARVGDDPPQIYRRSLGAFEAEPIAGTEGAAGPFLSPDGSWLGFYSHPEVKKVSLEGGALSKISQVEDTTFRGATWGEDDNVVYSQCSAGLYTVPATGGAAEMFTSVADIEDDMNHVYPQRLPGGDEVLFTIWNSPTDARVVVRNLVTGAQKTLVDPGTFGRYVPSGHLLYGWDGEILAVPFDLETLSTKGLPVRVVDDVLMEGSPMAAHFSVSETGTLAYVPGGLIRSDASLVWTDHSGEVEPLPFPAVAATSAVRISPDGQRVLVSIGPSSGGSRDLWIYDLQRGVERRLVQEGQEWWAVWAPDSRHVVYNSGRESSVNLYSMPVDGSGPEKLIAASEYWLLPYSVSKNGLLTYQSAGHPDTGFDIWTTSLHDATTPSEGKRESRLVLGTKYDEFHPTLSPDERWLAYVSTESGQWEVYVRPYPGPGAVTQVSVQGGGEPIWSPDGREIYYRRRRGSQVWAVSFSADGQTPRLGKPRLLFEGTFQRGGAAFGREYDLSPDGQRFLMLKVPDPPPPPTQFNIVLNWFDELRRLVPVEGG